MVVPAYNAEATIDETLWSVRRQTHRDLEVVVVDDGSTDRTAERAAAHAAEDSRIRLLRTANGGVAAARNAGIRASAGALIAPVDADDIWHPDKIARQVAAMQSGGDEMAYVYTGFRRIRGDGRVMGQGSFHDCRGRVFLRAVFSNFVGNGSALLFRRAAIEAVGGYEPALHRMGCQGAEDRLVQILMARHGLVGAVPGGLTGYRQLRGAMSKDQLRMLRSQIAVTRMVASRHPETPGWVLDATLAYLEVRMAVELGRRGRPAAALAALGRAGARAPRVARTELAIQAPEIARRAGRLARRLVAEDARPPADAPAFDALEPEASMRRPAQPDPYRWVHERLAAQEAAIERAPRPAPVTGDPA